jgi:3-oxoacyl-[acyl-carrier protein] reductase
MKNGVKRALVTGSSKGIGRSTALLLAQSGWEVGLTARSEQDLQEICNEIQTTGAQARAFPSDMGQLDSLQNLAKDYGAWQDGLDLLVCNAGVGLFKPFEEMTPKDWDFVMDVNLKGTTFLVQALLPLLKSPSVLA